MKDTVLHSLFFYHCCCCLQANTYTDAFEGIGPGTQTKNSGLLTKSHFVLFIGPVEECIATIENTVKVQRIQQD